VAAFLANVGVNSSHAARSPLFDDGTFELLPIPERHPWCPPMLRLGDLAAKSAYAPARWRDRAVHLDPDLDARRPTYGDNCRRAGRAVSLRRAERGDLVVFLARLVPAAGAAGFHLVGCLEIDDALEDVMSDPGSGWWDGNAHVRRARATGDWNQFWVFKGGPASRLLCRAVPFGREQANAVLGDTIRWHADRTPLQTIGSCTRAVRRIEAGGEEWLRTICLS
jgi:putative DNA base modification enzyme with NMAD domain